jgi:hypothetical protein
MRLLGTRGVALQAEDSPIKTQPKGWTGPVSPCDKRIEAGLAFYLGQSIDRLAILMC